jgi:hypothetical protein
LVGRLIRWVGRLIRWGLSAVVTTNTHTIFIAFLVFEACVGCYFPIMGAPS